MCDVCGCGDTRATRMPKKVSFQVHRSLLADNDREAAHLREHFVAKGVTVINLMGSPGSGKTAILESTAQLLCKDQAQGGAQMAAVSGDLATELDAQRLRSAGIPSLSITTGSACHLDAKMVHKALHNPELAQAVDGAAYFFIENVGNLVCPAIYDLGQRANVVVLSITEGEDKPLKYPVMFQHADLVLLTKVDLLPHLGDISLARLCSNVEQSKPGLQVYPVSARTGEGLARWTDWLTSLRPPLP